MSAGLKLLASIIANGSTGTLVGLERNLFLDSEVAAYDFVRQFYRQYRELPSAATLATDGGVRLPTASQNLDYHLDSVRDRQVYNAVYLQYGGLRDAIAAKDVGAIRTAIQALTAATRRTRNADDAIDIGQAIDLTIDRMFATRGTGGITGITSGWPGWDEQTGGYQPSDVITFAGRMGTGKTYMLLLQAKAAWLDGRSIVFFTTEMASEAIARRFIALELGIDPKILKQSLVSDRLARRIRDYRAAITEANTFKMVSLGVGANTARVNAAIEEYGPHAAYIDSFYILKPAAFHASMRRDDRVSETITEIKGGAIDYNIPFILTSSFNRSAGKGGKDGELENLAFSDAIGRDSSIVAGVKLGTGENEYATRRIAVLKGREGESEGIEINFQFNPLDMSEVVRDPNAPATPARDRTAPAANLDWMQNA